jgi:hypothetical protein
VSASNTSDRGGVDLQTLVITAVASACAAYVTSLFWARGALASAAITPVIVALVKEALAKPAEVITRAVPVRGVVRSAHPDEPYDPVQPFEPEDERIAQHGEIVGSSRPAPRRAWKMAVITGLLGFLVAAVIITVPELVSGKSVTGSDRTTLFSRHKKSPTPASTTTTTTPTDTQTAPPASTVTVPPVETTTVPPEQTTTVPPETPPAEPPAETTPEAPEEPAPEEPAP